MKISTSTGFLFPLSHTDAIRIVAEAGFDYADFSFSSLPKDTLLEYDAELAHFRSLGDYAQSLGISFNQAHAPYGSSTGDPEADAIIFKRIANSIRLSGQMGVTHVIVHPKQHIEYRYNEAICKEMNYEFYSALKPYAEDAGVKIAIENMWRNNRANTHIDLSVCALVEEHIEYVDMMGSPVFEACLDLGHAALVNEDPATSIRRLGKDRLHALHVHDVDMIHDSHTIPGCGKMDYKPIMKALKEIGYDGEFTLEAGAFANKFEPAFWPEAVKFMAKRARFLADMDVE